MITAIKFKDERENVQMTLGFDTDIFKAAVNKKFNQEPISELEKLSIENAIDFLNVIISFCEGIFEQHVTGLSGAEAYNIFVEANHNLTSLQEIKNKAETLKQKLKNLIQGEQIVFEERDEIIKVFNSINTGKKPFLETNDFMTKETYWWL